VGSVYDKMYFRLVGNEQKGCKKMLRKGLLIGIGIGACLMMQRPVLSQRMVCRDRELGDQALGPSMKGHWMEFKECKVGNGFDWLLLGKVRTYNAKGRMVNESNYKIINNGLKYVSVRDQKQKAWYSDGKTPMSEVEYKNGVIHGTMKVWHVSGNLLGLAEFRNGKFINPAKIWDTRGNFIGDVTFNRETLCSGPFSITDASGQRIAEGKMTDIQIVSHTTQISPQISYSLRFFCLNNLKNQI
jgi:hypothetical protein